MFFRNSTIQTARFTSLAWLVAYQPEELEVAEEEEEEAVTEEGVAEPS